MYEIMPVLPAREKLVNAQDSHCPIIVVETNSPVDLINQGCQGQSVYKSIRLISSHLSTALFVSVLSYPASTFSTAPNQASSLHPSSVRDIREIWQLLQNKGRCGPWFDFNCAYSTFISSGGFGCPVLQLILFKVPHPIYYAFKSRSFSSSFLFSSVV